MDNAASASRRVPKRTVMFEAGTGGGQGRSKEAELECKRSLKQYWRCRDAKCQRGGACVDREHLTPERRKELAAQAADQAGPSCLPEDAVLQDMTAPMLTKVCQAVGGVDQYKSLRKAPLLQAVKARIAELRSMASAAQVRSQPLDEPARHATPRCTACDALTATPAIFVYDFGWGKTFSGSIACMSSNTRARTMIECLIKQCTAVCSATWDQGGPDRSSTPRNFMSPATTGSKVSWHLAALAIACSIISIQRRVSASSQLVPNPVDHMKSFSSG